MNAGSISYRKLLLPPLAVLPVYMQAAASAPPLRQPLLRGLVSRLLEPLFSLLSAGADHSHHEPALLNQLLPRLQQRFGTFEEGNYDADRWGWDGVDRSQRIAMGMCWRQLRTLFAEQAQFEKAWALMADERSRKWMEDLLAYRILGHLHVRLPTNTAEHWALRQQAKSMDRAPTGMGYSPGMFGKIERFRLDFLGESLQIDGSWPNIVWTFLYRQYYFERDGVRIQAERDDYVIDAGSGFGDTALGFAAAVGEKGRVWSFDTGESPVIRTNIAQNPRVGQRITFVPQPLGDSASDPRGQTARLPGSTSIDDFTREHGIDHVDFIKMDVEGAELSALRGAEGILRRCRPKLAISAYHKDDDLATLPNWIDSLGLGYRFYIDHYTTHYEETILYAIADRSGLAD